MVNTRSSSTRNRSALSSLDQAAAAALGQAKAEGAAVQESTTSSWADVSSAVAGDEQEANARLGRPLIP